MDGFTKLLLSRRLRVRIPPRSQKTPEKQGFFHGKMNEPNLKYAKGMPIRLARFGQTGQYGWAKYALLDGMDEEIKDWSDEAAVQKPLVIWKSFIAVRIQGERRDPNSQLPCLAGLCNGPNQRLYEPKPPLVRSKEQSYQQYFQLPLFSVLLGEPRMVYQAQVSHDLKSNMVDHCGKALEESIIDEPFK